MTTKHHHARHLHTVTAVFLFLGLIIFTSVQAARYIDNRYTEYYLTGTLEEEANYNFNLSSGQSVQSNLTIINNDDTISKTYSLAGVDSEINNQQQIVFKAVESDNPNIGKWITFETDTVTIGPKSHVTIPFTIQIPDSTFPGTYFGGVSITKLNKRSSNDSASTLTVNVQTRTVLEMNINIDGTLNKGHEVENFYYDSDKNSFILTIKNTGNVMMSFEGELANQINSLYAHSTESVKIPPFRILPGTSVSHAIKHTAPTPLFGQFTASLKGDLSYFNGVTNQYEKFDTISAQSETRFFSWTIIMATIGILLVLILLMLFNMWAQKKYLKECRTYIVQPEDTIITVAAKHHMSWKKLVRINKVKAPYSLAPQQKILVHEKKNP